MKPIYSIIIPIHNEEGNIHPLHNKLSKVMNKLKKDYEIIFVNDGSTDNSLGKIKKLTEKDKKIKIINLSRNFGHQVALTAGLDYASGKAIITLDGDLQDPPKIIPLMIKSWEKGNEIVYARRKRRKDSFFKKHSAILYYKLLNKFSETEIPRNVGDFRLIDRKVLDELKKMGEQSRYLRGMVAWLGFKSTYIDFDRPKRKTGKTNYNLKKIFKLGMDGVMNFSFLPLKMGLFLGIASILAGLVFLTYMITDTLSSGIFGLYPLYKWLSVGFLMMFGLLFILIWILGEFIGRIYNETKKRPLYIIKENSFGR